MGLSPSLKVCNTCGSEKPFSEFHKNKKAKDGLQSKCKTCIREYQKTRIFNPKKTGLKICPNCKEEKPMNLFYFNKRKPDGRSSWCIACILGGGRTWESGYVYFVRGGDKIKIGFTKNHPSERLPYLQTGSPVLLVLLAYIKDEQAQQLEHSLHKMFSVHHSHGEWFFASKHILDFIVQIEKKAG